MKLATQHDTLIRKVVRVRLLLPLVVIAYVVLGGFVIPRTDVLVAHGILAVTAAATAFTSWLIYQRFKVRVDEPTHTDEVICTVSLVFMSGMILAAMAHIYTLIIADREIQLYTFEGIALAMAAVVFAVRAND